MAAGLASDAAEVDVDKVELVVEGVEVEIEVGDVEFDVDGVEGKVDGVEGEGLTNQNFFVKIWLYRNVSLLVSEQIGLFGKELLS